MSRRIAAAALLLAIATLARAQGGMQIPDKFRANFERGLRLLLTSLRNPQSLSFAEVIGNPAGHTVCFTYRAQNGFGGFSFGHFAYLTRQNAVLNDDDSAFRQDWALYCQSKRAVDLTAPAVTELKFLAAERQ